MKRVDPKLAQLLAEHFVKQALWNRHDKGCDTPFTFGEARIYSAAFKLAANEIFKAVSSAHQDCE